MREKKKRGRLLAVSVIVCMVFSLFTPTAALAEDEFTSLYGLTVNDLAEPMGLNDTAPVFAWKMKSNVTGQLQTAYRIRVATDAAMNQMVWDTGKKESGQSVGVAWDGDPLIANTTYYWQVTAWDKDDDPVVSAQSRFETGLLGDTASAWGDSQWIKVGSAGGNAQVNYAVEGDITCAYGAFGIVFNVKDMSNLFMWQFSTSTPNKVILRPHTKRNGAWTVQATAELTQWTGTPATFSTTPAHFRIEVNNTSVKTFINGSLTHTFNITESWNGVAPYAGNIGVRTSGAESGTLDNFKMYDYTRSEGDQLVHDYNFDNGINPFGSGTIANGVYSSTGGEEKMLPMATPTFRKEVDLPAKPVRARAYVTALGVFDVFVNGQRVGVKQDDDTIYDELKPGAAQPAVRVYSYAYDVTDLFNAGANTLSAHVTSGWWSGGIVGNYGKENAFRARIILQYGDGSTARIDTDTTWKSSRQGPILSADIYGGEYYDATKPVAFRQNGYDDESWLNAEVNSEFSGEITPQIGPPMRIRGDLTRVPQKVNVYSGATGATADRFGTIDVKSSFEDEAFALAAGEKAVIDLGQNFAGWEWLQAEGARGVTLSIRHGEMLNENNGLKSRGNDGPEGSIYTANLRAAAATTHYVLSGEGKEEYHPTATYYGFRYLEITANGPVTIHKVRGQVVTSVQEDTGKLSTDNADVNQLISNTVWGQYSNYVSSPTDCPQRDERYGWTADTQVFSAAAAYNADSKGFLAKFMQDMRDSQRASDGAYPDTAPLYRYGGHGNLGWGDAGVIVPYNIYMMYGDKKIITDNYASMKKFMDVFMANSNKAGGGHAYGDWLAYESNDTTIKNMLGAAYFAWDALMMSEMAAVIGKDEDAAKYKAVYEEEKAYFQQQFVNPDGSLKRTEQTACLFALKLDLLPSEASREMVTQSLLTNIRNHGNKLQTGFLGTSILMTTLSEIGAADVAWQLLLQNENPSWLYSVDQGATTIWERWNSYMLTTGFGDVGMNSFNHYAYGIVAEWLYRDMAGIKYDRQQPGFKHFILQPTPNPTANPEKTIEKVASSYESAYGTIVSNWEYKNNLLNYEASVPANASATIYVPASAAADVTVNGKPAAELTGADGIVLMKVEDGKAVFESTSGTFLFAAKAPSLLKIRGSEPKAEGQISVNDGPWQSLPLDLTIVAGDPITIKSRTEEFDYTAGGFSGAQTSPENQITFEPPAGTTNLVAVYNVATPTDGAIFGHYLEEIPGALSLNGVKRVPDGHDGQAVSLTADTGIGYATISRPDDFFASDGTFRIGMDVTVADDASGGDADIKYALTIGTDTRNIRVNLLKGFLGWGAANGGTSQNKASFGKSFDEGDKVNLVVEYEENNTTGLITVYLNDEKVVDKQAIGFRLSDQYRNIAHIGYSLGSAKILYGIYDNILLEDNDPPAIISLAIRLNGDAELGNTVTPTLIGVKNDGTETTFPTAVFTSSDPSVARVNGNGTVDLLKKGSFSLKASTKDLFDQLDPDFDFSKFEITPLYKNDFSDPDNIPFSGTTVEDGRLYVDRNKNAIYPGGTQWTDYIMTASLYTQEGAGTSNSNPGGPLGVFHFRAANTSNLYMWQIYSSNHLKKHVNVSETGSKVKKISNMKPINEENRVAIAAEGNRIMVYANGRLVDTDYYSNYAAGSIGVRTDAAEFFYLDDLVVGTRTLTQTDAFKVGVYSKTDLTTLVDQLSQTYGPDQEDLYTTGSWKDFSDAMDDANAVLLDDDATPDEVYASFENLAAAAAGLQLRAADFLLELLQDMVDQAEAEVLYEEEYDPDAWKALDDGVKAAKEILKTPAVYTDAEVMDVAMALLGALEEMPAARNSNKTNLRAAILAGEDEMKLKDKYVPAAVARLEAKLQAAKTINANPSASQDQVNTAADELIQAIIDMQEKGNKTSLIALTNLASKYVKANYTPASWQTFEDAVGAAETVIDNENAMKHQVEKAFADLTAAMKALVRAANFTALDAAIDAAQAIVDKIEDYVASTVVGLSQELDSAKTVQSNPNATQTQVNTATSGLNAKILKARLKPDLSQLLNLVAKASGLKASSYTSASASTLNTALAKANAVLKTSEDKLLQKDVDAAYAGLLKAMATLKEADDGKAPAGAKQSESADGDKAKSASATDKTAKDAAAKNGAATSASATGGKTAQTGKNVTAGTAAGSGNATLSGNDSANVAEATADAGEGAQALPREKTGGQSENGSPLALILAVSALLLLTIVWRAVRFFLRRKEDRNAA